MERTLLVRQLSQANMATFLRVGFRIPAAVAAGLSLGIESGFSLCSSNR
jgi:hypothetical protein